jgi:hypothetical protein
MRTMTLIICLALLVPAGISPVMGATLVKEPTSLEVSQPKSLEVSEPETQGVLQPETQGVSKLDSLEVSEPKSMESGSFLKGEYARVQRENVEYLRCAVLKGFNNLLKCALEALDVTRK